MHKMLGKKVFFVGIKGTGMAALAELFQKYGAFVSGSDTHEVFYTDQVLKNLGIKYFESFSASNLDFSPSEVASIEDNLVKNPISSLASSENKIGSWDLVVYSSAYSRETAEDLAEAYRRGISVMEYTEALGAFSRTIPSCAIAGVHGKTTTTGITGSMLISMNLPVSVLAGSAVANFGDKSTYTPDGESAFFVAETCEYKRHFLSFSPAIILVTSIELDHVDYFSDYDDIFSAFREFGEKLPNNGVLIYCADDKGAADLGRYFEANQADGKKLVLIPYGEKAEGAFGITSLRQEEGKVVFALRGLGQKKELEIPIPGKHSALNSAGAVAVSASIACALEGIPIEEVLIKYGTALASGAASFRGSKRRSELWGEAGGIVFMDDYGHHPTAVDTTLKGIKEFYPGRRIVVDFMSHTYSRTKALLDEFAASFSAADMVILNKIYASARETVDANGIAQDSLDKKLFEKIKENHKNVFYFHELSSAADFLKKELKEGDLFVTMGAGDNWKLVKELFNYFKGEKK